MNFNSSLSFPSEWDESGQILIVDDETLVLESLEAIFEHNKFQIVSANSAKEAKSLLKKNSFKLIISDVHMPDEDGLSFLKYVKKKFPHIPFILMTGYWSESDKSSEALKLGAEDCIFKPFNFEELILRVKNVIEKVRLRNQLQQSEKLITDYSKNLEWIIEQKVKELQLSEKNYKDLFENAFDMIIVIDEDGRFIEANNRLYKLLGYTSEELELLNITDWVAPEDIITVGEFLKKVKRKKMASDLEIGVFKKSGKRITVEVNATGRYNNNGDFVAVQAIIRDVSGRKRLQNRIQKSEQRYRGMIDSFPGMIYIIDKNGNYTYFSRKCDQLTGYQYSDFLSNKIRMRNLIHPDDKDTIVPMLKRLRIEESSGVNQEFRIIHKSGDVKWVSCSWAPLHENREFVGVQFIFLDISKRKQLEEELKEVDKVELIGKFASGVISDLRNPLAGLTYNIEGLLMEMDDKNPFRKRIEETLTGVNRMQVFLKGISQLSDKFDAKIKSSNLKSVFGDTVVLLRPLINQFDVRIKETWDETIPPVDIDPDQFRIVFLNIMANSIEAMDDGGEIKISAKMISKSAKDYVQLVIQDTGAGIPNEMLNRIFDPFYTTKQDGTGLGLPICARIVENHSCTLDVQSMIDTGTRFTILFPVEKPVSQAS